MALSELLYLTKSSILVVTPFNDMVDAYNQSFNSLCLWRSNGVIMFSKAFKISAGCGSSFAFNSEESILNSPWQDSNGMSLVNISFYILSTAKAY